MKTYTILLAADFPHYATTEIEAANATEAVERAEDLDFDHFLLEPDWENPVCQRIVSITDDTGAQVAHDIALDGYSLHHDSERAEARPQEPTPSPAMAEPGHSNIRVTVRGGLVQAAETLDGHPVLVDVIDYDRDGADPQALGADSSGETCWRYTT
jgi:hypothetical protein